MDDNTVMEQLDRARNTCRIYPAKIRAMYGDRIDEVEFDRGRYRIQLESGAEYLICAVCGETQPMNQQAYIEESMEYVVEAAAEHHADTLQSWNNAPCERKHPPFRVEA